MLKRILFIILFLIIGAIASVLLYFGNPKNPQYISYYKENKAMECYNKRDVECFFKYMDNPVTVKYHESILLFLTYQISGKYDDAIRVLESHEKYEDYSFCARYKLLGKAACRIMYLVKKPDDFFFDKNKYISLVYFDKGDYKSAEEYIKKSEKINPCYMARLYSAMGNMPESKKYLEQCRIRNKDKKYKNDLYLAQGYVFLKQKKYKESEEAFKKAVNKNCLKKKNCRANNTVYLYLGELYKLSGKKKKANEYFKKVIESEPYNYRAKKNLY